MDGSGVCNTGVSTIGSQGFATDGAWHVDLTSGTSTAKITWDRTRIRPNVMIEKWPDSGVSPQMEENGIRADCPTGTTYFMCNMAAEVAGASTFVVVGGVSGAYEGYQDVVANETWEFDDSFAAPPPASKVIIPPKLIINTVWIDDAVYAIGVVYG